MFNKGEHRKQKNVRSLKRSFKRFMCALFVSLCLFGSVLTTTPKPANACTGCVACWGFDTSWLTPWLLDWLNSVWEPIVVRDITYVMNNEYRFLNSGVYIGGVFRVHDGFFEEFYVKALAELTEYLSAYGLYQVEMVGSFFDARNQLEASRAIFKLQAQAHKDYHVSEDFCWIGTNARSLAATESRARVNLLALSKVAMDRQLGKKNAASGFDEVGDKTARWHQFVDTFCDEKDNGWDGMGGGLERACDHDGKGAGVVFGANDRSRINTDLDYTRLIEISRTLDVDFSNVTATPDEESVLAMSSNLFGNMVPSRSIEYTKMKKNDAANSMYTDQRTVIARRGVAQNSFNAIVALKSAGTSSATTNGRTASYMGAILKELMPVGTTDSEVLAILGENPSYYAQLEVLAKKIYQNPKFFAKLYDTPVNVERKGVAMKAIELMLDRALFESELRQEMLLSVMLSSELDQSFRQIDKDMSGSE